jgi:hypothetical protein
MTSGWQPSPGWQPSGFQNNPELATASYKANLNKQDMAQVDTWARLYEKHRELKKMEPDLAFQEFTSLDENIQGMIKETFGEQADYTKNNYDNTLLKYVTKVPSVLFNTFVKSPFQGVMKGLDTYVNLIHAPAIRAKAAQQGETTSFNIWDEDWDGKRIFDKKTTDFLDTTYGTGIGVLARGLVSGRSIGKIIETNRGVDPELEAALNYMQEYPVEFQSILKDYKRAQFSPGRDLNRNSSTITADAGPDTLQELIFDKQSGVDDLIYDIVGDPLTWATAGIWAAAKLAVKGSSLVLKGEVGSQQLRKFVPSKGKVLGAMHAKNPDLSVGVAFKQPEVREVWDNLGPLIKRYKESVNPAEKANVMKEIGIRYPMYNNEQVINIFAGNLIRIAETRKYTTSKIASQAEGYVPPLTIEDAKSAELFFKNAEHTQSFFTGRSNSMIYYTRHNVATATVNSKVATRIRYGINNLFNTAPDAQKGKLTLDKIIMRSEAETEAALYEGKVIEVGINDDPVKLLANLKNTDPTFQQINTTLQKFPERITKYTARHPLGRPIWTNDEDVFKTVDAFRDLARMVLPRDSAAILAQRFLDLPQDNRLVLLRGLYTDVMYSAGLGALPDGSKIIKEALDVSFGAPGSMATAGKIGIPKDLPISESLRKTAELGDMADTLLPNGPLHGFQFTGTLAMPDWNQISQLTSKVSQTGAVKWNMLRRLSSVTNGTVVGWATRQWGLFTLAPKLGVRSTIDELFLFTLYAPQELIWNLFKGVGATSVKLLSIARGNPSGLSYSGENIFKFQEKLTPQILAKISERSKEYAKTFGEDYKEVYNREVFKEAILSYQSVFGPKAIPIDPRKLSNEALDDLQQLVMNGINGLDLVGSTTARVAGAGGSVAQPEALVRPGAFEEWAKENNIKLSRKWSKLNEDAELNVRLAAQLANVSARFTDAKKLKDTFNITKAPSYLFTKHNGLRTYEDFTRAVDESIANIKRGGLSKRFLEANAEYAKLKTTLTDDEILRQRVELLFLDLRNSFHGSSSDFKVFNQKLYDLITRTERYTKESVVPRKAIEEGHFGQGTKLGAKKDIAMRNDSDAALVELENIEAETFIKDTWTPKAKPSGLTTDMAYNTLERYRQRGGMLGKTSSETSLRTVGPIDALGPINQANFSGKTIMLARNGKLAGKELRPDTIDAIKKANDAGAKFVVGDMPNVDEPFIKLLSSIDADFTVYHSAEKGIRVGVPLKRKEFVTKGESNWTADDWKNFKPQDYFDMFKGDNPATMVSGTLMAPFEQGATDFIDALDKFGMRIFEVMDQQVTSYFRAPAFTVAYLANMEKYRTDGFRKAYLEQLLRNKETTFNQAYAITNRAMVEFASQDSLNFLTKFADNPNVRTTLAFNMRNASRFYRANEDFIRRFYRLKDYSLEAIVRLKLAHQGLSASGIVHQDAQGESYVLMPMDDLIFNVVQKPVSILMGAGEGYKQPLFNNFTLKLTQVNPSFGPDATTPTLSGPVAGLSVMAFKAIAGQFGDTGKLVADKADTAFLGQLGDNVTLRKAVLPIFFDRVWRALDANEKDKQELSAIHQAISYEAAHGRGLSSSATASEKYEYMKNIRIQAHNLIVMKSILGLLPIPWSPGAQESKDIPDFLKEVGVTSPSKEFYQIYESVLKNPNPRLDDPFEEAIALFVGNNPNKLIYTVSRTDKLTNIVVKKSEEVKNWAITNQDTINKYGEAAWLAAPNIGDFDPQSYAWFEASGLIKNKSMEDYLLETQIAVDKSNYFNIKSDALKELETTADFAERTRIINGMKTAQQNLKNQNPLLKARLEQGDFSVGPEEQMLNNVKNMLNDSAVVMDANTRKKLLMASEILTVTVEKIRAEEFDFNQDAEFPRLLRDKAIEDLKTLASVDSTLQQANKAIFFPILRHYSRDGVIK